MAWSSHFGTCLSCLVLRALALPPPAALISDDCGADFGSGTCLLQRAASGGSEEARAQLALPQQEAAPAACQSGNASSAFAFSLRHQPDYWVNKNGDASCTGASRHAGPFNVAGGPTWSYRDETASIVRSHPVIDGERNVYLAHLNGKVRKFSPSGEVLWTNEENYGKSTSNPQAAQYLAGGLLLMDGRIYAGTQDGHVTCMDAGSGTTLWHKKVALTAAGDAWSLAGRAGIVVVAASNESSTMSGNNEIIALDGSDGSVIWRWAVPHGKHVYNWLGSLADDPPSIVFTNSHGRPYRLRLCDGKTLWEAKEHHGARESPGMSTGGAVLGPNGLVYVTSNFHPAAQQLTADAGIPDMGRGRLSAYNVSTGELVWSADQSMPANNAPSVGKLGSDGRLSVVIAIGKNSGFPNPIAEATGKFLSGNPVEFKSKVLALDAGTGVPTGWAWTAPAHRKPQAEGDHFPDHICLPDAWSNGAIDGRGTYYIGHMSGNLFALRDADGDGKIDEGKGEVSRYYGGRCYQGSPGIAPGMVVSTPCDGMHVWRE